MRNNAVIRIIIYSIIIFLLLAFLLAGISFGSFAFRTDSSTETVTTEGASLDASKISKLDIDWASGTISIKAADVDSISFTESGAGLDKHKMVYSLEGDTLSIFYQEPQSYFGIYSGSYPEKSLTILVPKAWICRELKVDSASTDAVIENMTIQAVDLDSASNEFRFENCQIGSLDMDGASNIVTLTGTLDTLDCDGMSCELTLQLTNTPSSMDLDGMSTVLEVTLPRDTGFYVAMDGMSNQFHSDFDVSHTGDGYSYGDCRLKIESDGMSSTITIHEEE